jgi:hypothetical protein
MNEEFKLRFERGHGLPVPISVGGAPDELIIILDEGAT